MTTTTTTMNSTTTAMHGTPMTGYDAFALFAVAAPCSAVMLLLIAVAAVRYKRYAPLRATNVPNLVFMTLSGVVHLWATAFVVMRQLWPSVYYTVPVLWTPWIEYFFGLGMWTAWLFMRPINYSLIFRRRLRQWSARRRALFRILAFLVLLAPSLVLSVIGTFRVVALERESHRQQQQQTPPLPPPPPTPFMGNPSAAPPPPPLLSIHSLQRPTWYTGVMAVWLTLEIVVCVALMLSMTVHQSYRTKGSIFAEVAPLRFSLLVGIVGLVVVAVLRLIPNVESVAGMRATVVVVLAVMHTAVVLRYLALPTWYAVRNDRAYADHFEQRWVLADGIVPSNVRPRADGVEHLQSDKRMLAMFLMYLHTKVAADPSVSVLGNAGGTVCSDARRVRRMVDCITLISARANGPQNQLVPAARHIIMTFLSDNHPTADSLPSVPPPLGTVTWFGASETMCSYVDVFDALQQAIVNELHSAHWERFADEYASVVREWRSDVVAQREVMQQDGFLDPLNTEVALSHDNNAAGGGGGGGGDGDSFVGDSDTDADGNDRLVVARHYTDSEDDDDDGARLIDDEVAPERRTPMATASSRRKHRRVSVRSGAGNVVLSDDITQAPAGYRGARQWKTPENEVTQDLFEYANAKWATQDGGDGADDEEGGFGASAKVVRL